MKRIATKVQEMARRADEIRRVVEGVPPKIAEVREAVASTVGHVQKLRGELMTGLGTLRLENEGQMLESLREIDRNVEVLREAGCEVERADLDLGPTRKLVVHLRRVEDVDAEELRRLIDAHQALPTVRALLAAVLKADELASGVALQELSYARLTVELGAYPSVRMGWRSEEASGASVAAAAMSAAPESSATAAAPVFAQTNYFERRPINEPSAARSSAETPVEAPKTEAPAAKAQPVKNAWGAEALARFKKMPEVR